MLSLPVYSRGWEGGQPHLLPTLDVSMFLQPMELSSLGCPSISRSLPDINVYS